MASSKYKGGFRKKPDAKLDVVVSRLRKENAYLRKTLAEMSHQHAQHNEEVEGATAEEYSSTYVVDIQKHLRDALEKSKQWLEYDRFREAYSREIQERVLLLEKELCKTNQVFSQQHNNDRSHENKEVNDMKDYHEGLQEKGKDEQKVLKEQVDGTRGSLIPIKEWWDEMLDQMNEFKERMQVEEMSRNSAAAYQLWCEETSNKTELEGEVQVHQL